jgi:hypothetical protein
VQADEVEVEASRPDFDYDVKPGFTKVPEPGFQPGQGLNKLVCLPTLNKCTEFDDRLQLRTFSPMESSVK